MILKAVVGALRVVLGMDSAAFDKGADAAEKRAKRLRKTMTGIGHSLQGFGKKMSVGVTAPLMDLIAGANGAAGALTELNNQARMAGVGVERFKIMSLAVKGLGVDADKLSDILKDVNDKMGDYFQTGAGPMADFFENIAPKVGLTADAFKGLTSEQVLIKYVKALQDANVSQAEMTFYLEALASDATLLLPALINNGAAIEETSKRAKELGLVLSEETIEAAKSARGEFALVSEVIKTRLQAALLPLAAAFSRVAQAALPVLEDIAAKVASVAEAFANLSPGTQEFIVKAGLLAAALGPVAVALGAVVTAIAPLVAALAALSTPVLLAGAAVVGLGVILWSLRDKVAAVAAKFWEFMTVPGKVADAISAGTERISQAIADIWEAIWVEVSSWPGKMVEMGRNIVQGLIDGIAGKNTEAASAGRNAMRRVREAAEDEAGIQSPSRVFMGIGSYLMQGLGLGIQNGTVDAAAKMRDAATTISAQMSAGNAGIDGVTGAVEHLGDTSGNVFEGMGRWLVDLAKGAKTLRGTIANLMSQWSSALGRSGMNGLGNILTGSFGRAGGGLLTGILGGLMGFASGGSFEVGGAGGIDSQLVAFRASPDERVTVTRPDQAMPGQGGVLRVVVETSEDLKAVAAMSGGKVALQVVDARLGEFAENQQRSRGGW
jgi:hypothetical protein